MKLSLPARALLALVLTIGFYALAFGIMAGLGWIAYESFHARLGFAALKVTAFCAIGIVTILFSILPQREEFAPPGPLLTPDAFPELFLEVGAIAAKAGQAGPGEIYLLPQLNAFVSGRGGFFGIGRIRILGVGLPLLQVLTRNELRAVLAHEFGHYHGGDTALGPFIHRVRSAVMRTVESLAKHSTLLRRPFEWYGILFLRISQAVSRSQEFSADRLAAELVGAEAMASGLRKVHVYGALNHAFWGQEVEPAVKQGFRPALAAGFISFLGAPEVAAARTGILADVLGETRTDPYDSHPCLRDRLLALGAGEGDDSMDSGEDGSGKALALVEGFESLEPALYGFLLGINPGKLSPLDWGDSGERVHRPRLEEFHRPFAASLQGIRLEDYPGYLSDPALVAERLRDVGGVPEEPAARLAFVSHLLDVHLALALFSRGWTLRSGPGEALACRPPPDGGGEEYRFGSLRADLLASRLTTRDWAGKCRAWGLA